MQLELFSAPPALPMAENPDYAGRIDVWFSCRGCHATRLFLRESRVIVARSEMRRRGWVETEPDVWHVRGECSRQCALRVKERKDAH